ncbi:hypothetical protein [Deinococcus sp. Leaf326]|uniref:hypothetical protein n=1 Tax=Deinococcus sp. Leaf326 TaxID=1736338 RepID=UPI0006F9A2FE|nr:hypothetical protein [Deinococcus sp. Leaf326]KQR41103.1 hypothetical protein ASF71_02985 [Deinococcus sp. Leaf326]
MRSFLVPVAAALCLYSSASAVTWVGAEAGTGGYGAHAGTSLLRVPLIGALGVEGSLERGWKGAGRVAAGVTLRDVNLPLTRTDAFATVGAAYQGGFNVYAEGGLRGPLLGPAGWRGYVRGSTAGFGAGVGLELRF